MTESTNENRPKPEQVFYSHTATLIKNLFIDNVNYTNGYYSRLSYFELISQFKEKARYILETMEDEKHLINL